MKRARRFWVLTGSIAACAALVAVPAYADGTCSGGTLTQPLPDAGACLDVMQYNAYHMLAAQGWSIDRGLLVASFQLDSIRVWLVHSAFLSVYGVLVDLIGPMIGPLAALAGVIACLLYLLLPLTGLVRLLDIRHILTWAVLGPALLTLSGPLLAQVDDARASLGITLFTGAARSGSIPTFGVAAADTALPEPLYANRPCGLARPSSAAVVNLTSLALLPDDVAAAYVYADGIDVHCPQSRVTGGGATTPILLPDAYYRSEASGGPGYAKEGGIDAEPVASARRAAIERMQLGAQRAWEAIPLALFAALFALINLGFSAALIAVWLCLPITMAFIVFEPNANSFTHIFRGGLNVLKTSWVVSVALGIVFGCVLAAANLRNASAVNGFSLLSLVAGLYSLFLAGSALMHGISTLNTSATGAIGLSVAAPARTMSSTIQSAAGGIAAGALSKAQDVGQGMGTGLEAAATTAAAYSTTGSGAYAAGVVLGRIGPVAKVGQIAAMMGLVEHDIGEGLYTGERIRRTGFGYRAQRMMDTDAVRKDVEGATIGQRAAERRENTALFHSPTTSGVQHVVHGVVIGQGGATRLTPDAPFVVQNPQTAPLDTLNIARLRGLGYQVRLNPNRTATYGKPISDDPHALHNQPRTRQQVDLDAAEERLHLITRGGIKVDDREQALQEAKQAIERARSRLHYQDALDKQIQQEREAVNERARVVALDGKVVEEQVTWQNGQRVQDASRTVVDDREPITTPPFVRGFIAPPPAALVQPKVLAPEPIPTSNEGGSIPDAMDEAGVGADRRPADEEAAQASTLVIQASSAPTVEANTPPVSSSAQPAVLPQAAPESRKNV